MNSDINENELLNHYLNLLNEFQPLSAEPISFIQFTILFVMEPQLLSPVSSLQIPPYVPHTPAQPTYP